MVQLFETKFSYASKLPLSCSGAVVDLPVAWPSDSSAPAVSPAGVGRPGDIPSCAKLSLVSILSTAKYFRKT